MLPEPWRATAYSILATIVSIAVVVAGLKPLIAKYIGEPSANDPNWKRVIYFVLKVLDYAALNSTTVKARKELHQAKTTLNLVQAIPPQKVGK